MKYFSLKNTTLSALLLTLLFSLIAGTAISAGGNTDFDLVLTLLTDWMTGSLGKVIAIAAVLVGLAIGIVRQSVIAVVVGVAMALALFNAPGVIDAIFGATIV